MTEYKNAINAIVETLTTEIDPINTQLADLSIDPSLRQELQLRLTKLSATKARLKAIHDTI